MDADLLAGLLQPGVLQKYLQEQQQRTIQATDPNINVPVYVEPDPITLRGTVELEVVFPYGVIVNQPYDTLVEKTYEVLQGNAGSWLPTIRYGGLKLWRVVSESDVRAAGADRAVVPGGIPQAGDPGHSPGPGHPEPGVTDSADADPGDWTGDGPVDSGALSDYLSRLIQSATGGHGEGAGSDEPVDSGIPRPRGPGWATVEPAGEEEAGEEG